jgi:tetratricopeptide (TPR) repeat protein
VALAAAVAMAFWPALRCGFIDFDDGVYVTQNPHIQAGLNWANLKWAFTATNAGYWLPLAWLSHMTDIQFFQMRPAGHHFTSLLWHAANSVLLFLLLQRATGAFWRSALAAALFALHPLRVESVVWVAERKDVLSTFFWILTMWSYTRYAQDHDAQRGGWKVFYLAAVGSFTMGLMAKPMLVTLPFVLLLLDVWPLRRWSIEAPFSRGLLWEKVPFLVLALVFSAITFLSQNSIGTIKPLSRFSYADRLSNVPVSYLRYLAKMFWPENLAIFYPPKHWTSGEVAAATVALAAISAWALRQWRVRPYLAVGWLWFLGTLVPVIGLVQAGDQAMADRFTYVPCVGLLFMTVWGGYELAARQPILLRVCMGGGGLAVGACAILTWHQIGYWQNNETVFLRAWEVTGQNYIASYNLGCAALAKGNYGKAVEYFEESLLTEGAGLSCYNPAKAHNNLGAALLQQGRVAQAVAHFESALAVQPSFPEAYYNLGRAFMTNRQPDVALDCFRRALGLAPDVADINYSLGETLLEQGHAAEAETYLEKALRLRPAFALAHEKMADALARSGRVAEGLPYYRRARELALAQGNLLLAAAAETRLSQYAKSAPVRPPGGHAPGE